MNNVVARRGIAALLFLYLSFHCLMIAMYNLPDNLMVPLMKVPLNGYVLPFFGQNWSLFAPDPGGYVAGYRFRYRYVYPNGQTAETQFIDATALMPSDFSGPFHPLSLLREISYSCATLAENEAVKKHKSKLPERDPDSYTIRADLLGAANQCTARVALSLAPKLEYGLTRRRDAQSEKTSVQLVFTIAAARRVNEAFAPGAGPPPTLKPAVVHTTPWLISAAVPAVPAYVETNS